MPARFGPGAVRKDGSIGMIPVGSKEGSEHEESSAMDGVLKVGLGTPRFRPVPGDRPLLTLAVAFEIGRPTCRTTWRAPKGSRKAHRVSPLGTGKEMQKLREGTGHTTGCRWGGFSAFTSHQEHVTTAVQPAGSDIDPRGSLQKRMERDRRASRDHKAPSPSLRKKTHSETWDRHTHRSGSGNERASTFAARQTGVGLSPSIGDREYQGCEKPGGFAQTHHQHEGNHPTWADGRTHRKVGRQRHRSSRPVEAVAALHLRRDRAVDTAGEGGQVSRCW